MAGPARLTRRATLGHVLSRSLVGRVHSLSATSVRHTAHGRELHVVLHLSMSRSHVLGWRLSWMALLGLSGVAAVARLGSLRGLGPDLLSSWIAVPRTTRETRIGAFRNIG